MINQSLKHEINRALNSLTHKESIVLQMYYGINRKTSSSLSEIGETINLSRERVRQVKQKALRRLQSQSRNKVLKTYLG
jgi:RNA polymerase primary sigma factor